MSKQCLSTPVSVCGGTAGCNNGTTSFNSPSDIPTCSQDGPAKSFVDASGVSRYYCQFRPTGGTAKKPLILWFHGGSGSADNLYSATQLRSKAETQKIHLVSVQSRNLQVDLARLKDGHHFDSWWWDFKAPTKNLDMSAIDDLIQLLAAAGDVDTSRIYLVGWSEGGMLSQLYGFARFDTASVYGHKVAAVGIYSASSPFHRKYENEADCSPDLQFKSKLPIYTISRSCDLIACNQQHQDSLWSQNSFADVINIQKWKDILSTTIENNQVVHTLLDKNGTTVSACTTSCTLNQATINHLTWPLASEDQMLTFLLSHSSN